MQRLKTILSILAHFLIVFSVQGQWTQMPTTLNTRPIQLLEINGKVMVSDDYGLAFSTDNGVHWKRTSTDFRIAKCVTEGNLLYAITMIPNTSSERTLLRSADEGESWDTIASFLIAQPTRMLKVDNYFYFMTQQFGGASTVEVFDLSTNQLTQLGYFYSGFFDLQYAYELKSIGNNVFFASDWGLIRYKDGGSQVDTLDHSKISMLAVNGDTLFSHGIYYLNYSVDAGNTWTLIPDNNNLPYVFIKALYFKDNRPFLISLDSYNSCSEVKLWESNSSFTEGTLKLRLKDGNCINDLLLTSNGTLIVATDYQCTLTLNPADQTWFVNNSGLGGYNFRAIRQDDLFVSGDLLSRDTGLTWSSPLISPVSYYFINSIVKKDSFYYAAVNYAGLWKSLDLKNWEELVQWVPHINKVGDYLMTTTASGNIQLSTNGLNWTSTTNQLQQSYFPPNQIQGNIIYDLRYDPGLGRIAFQSTYDLGATWQNPGLDFLESNAEEFQEISAWKSNVYLLTLDPQTQHKKLYGSHDFGYNWKKIPVPTDYLGYDSYACTDNLLFATDYETIWVTANDGEIWTELDRDTFNGAINYLEVAFGKLWVSTETEYWVRNLDAISTEVYKGTVFHDQNFNNIHDNGEPGIGNVILEVSNRDWHVVTDSIGRYEIKAELLNDSIAVIKPIAYCTVVPNVIPANNNQFNHNDFAIQIEPNITDVSVTAVNAQVFRPGFETEVFVAVKNAGTTALDSVQFVLSVLDLLSPLQFLEATPPPDLVVGDSMIWNNLNIELFGRKDIKIRYKTKISANLLNIAQLRFAVNQPDDIHLSDNIYTLSEPLFGSYDPNDKRVQPDTVSPLQLAQTDLYYTIRFQNTGNYPADFVTILDTLPDELNISTLKILAASHPFRCQINNGRVLEFKFDPIFLPDSTSNEVRSHGFVQFSIRAKDDLPLGKIIPNRAAIYFDYNPPVLTEYSKMYVENPVSSTKEGYLTDPIGITPNPANDRVIFEKKTDSPGYMEIYRKDGRLIFQQSTVQKSVVVIIADWPNGLYFVNWKTGLHSSTGKFMKQ